MMMSQEAETLRLEEPSPEEDVTPNTAEYVTHVITYSKYFSLEFSVFQVCYKRFDKFKWFCINYFNFCRAERSKSMRAVKNDS